MQQSSFFGLSLALHSSQSYKIRQESTGIATSFLYLQIGHFTTDLSLLLFAILK
jgi:hypothetical protein